MNDLVLHNQKKQIANDTVLKESVSKYKKFSLKPFAILITCLCFIILSIISDNLFLAELIVCTVIVALLTAVYLLSHNNLSQKNIK